MAMSPIFQSFVGVREIIRDFSQVFTPNANMVIDVVIQYKVIGLDWSIFNRGVAPLTIAIDGGPADTIAPAGSRWANSIKFHRINVVATDAYTLYLAGVKF